MVFWILVGVSISCSSGDDFVGVVVVLETVVCVMSMAQTFRWCVIEKSKGGCVIKCRKGIMVVEEYQKRKHKNKKMKMKDGGRS